MDIQSFGWPRNLQITDGRTQGPGDHFSALIPAWEVEKKGVFTLETIE